MILLQSPRNRFTLEVRNQAVANWTKDLPGDPTDWLLETEHPGVRYLALRDLIELEPDDPDLRKSCQKAHKEGPIAALLDEMESEGYWCKPGPGYLPKYRSSAFQYRM